MKTHLSNLLIALSLLSPVFAKANIECSTPRFTRITEFLKVTDATTSQPKISWTDADDYSQLESAIKYVHPDFSEKIVGVKFTQGEACSVTNDKRLLHDCSPHTFGDKSKAHDVNIQFASGKSMTINAVTDFFTTRVRRSVIGFEGKVSNYDTYEANLLFQIFEPGAQTVYARIDNLSFLGCK